MTLKQALESAIKQLDEMGGELPLSVHADLYAVGIKNASGLARSIRGAVKRLYASADTTAFIGDMYTFIEAQFTAAWFEGMAQNGLSRGDMTDEWQVILNRLIANEQAFIYGFANEIVDAALGLTGEKKPIDPFLTRADLWGNRYNEIVNEAVMITSEAGERLEWIYGDTEHCGTCDALNGIVATVSEWVVAGVKPQNAPNPQLTCGGWRCKCRLEPTDKRRTKDAFGKILDAIANA